MRQRRIAILIMLIFVALFLNVRLVFSYSMNSAVYEILTGAFTAGQNLTSSGGNLKMDFSTQAAVIGNATQGDVFVRFGLGPSLNSEPNVSSVDLIPDSPMSNETLNCTFRIDEQDIPTNLTVNVTFWMNYTTYGNYIVYANPNSLTGYNVTPGVQQKGEAWLCTAKAFDGIVYGNTTNSTLENVTGTPPQATNVHIISSDYPYNFTTSNLIGEWTFTDSDPGDTNQSTEIRWYRNGTQEATAQNQNLLNSSNTSTGDVWTFSVRVYDGILWSEWTNASITIHGRYPVVGNIITYNRNMVETRHFSSGQQVIIRVNISDPDGATDIASALIKITDSKSAIKVNNISMTLIATVASDNIMTFQYNYTLPGGPGGTWTITIYGFDSGNRMDTNSTTIQVTRYNTIQVTLVLNNTHNSVYVYTAGETNASLLGYGATYTSLSHWYLASYHSSLMGALVAAGANEISVNKSASTHMLQMDQNLTNSMFYLPVTEGDWRILDYRIGMIETGDFMLEVAPSFSFGLGLYHPIKTVINYTTIDVQGDLIFGEGLHKIEIESNRTDGQKAVYIRELFE